MHYTGCYFWRDNEIQREYSMASREERLLNCNVPCFDPEATSDKAQWGMWELLDPAHYARSWKGLGKDRIPKDFLLALLITGVFDE